MRNKLIAVSLLALIPGAALAQLASPLPRDGPVDLQGNGDFLVNPDKCQNEVNSGARVTNGPARLQATRIVVTGSKVKGDCVYDHVEAVGNVFYVTPQLTVKADKGVYDGKTSSLVFTGAGPTGVIAVSGRDVMANSNITYDTATGAAKGTGGLRIVAYIETAYRAAGAGWSLTTSSAALSLTRTGAPPVDVSNPGRTIVNPTAAKEAQVLNWTTPALKVTLTPGTCTFQGKTYAYSAQVQAGAASYTGCGDTKSNWTGS